MSGTDIATASDAEAFVITSASKRSRAVISVVGEHKCLDCDNRGHIVPVKNPLEPTATTRIEMVS